MELGKIFCCAAAGILGFVFLFIIIGLFAVAFVNEKDKKDEENQLHK